MNPSRADKPVMAKMTLESGAPQISRDVFRDVAANLTARAEGYRRIGWTEFAKQLDDEAESVRQMGQAAR